MKYRVSEEEKEEITEQIERLDKMELRDRELTVGQVGFLRGLVVREWYRLGRRDEKLECQWVYVALGKLKERIEKES